MKKVFSIFFLLIWFAVNGSSETKLDGEIIDYTQKIQYLSQKIANDYMFYFSDPKNIELKKNLKQSVKELESSFRFIASNTTNEDDKNILDYLSYSKDEIKTILNDDVNLENTKLILDQSQSLYEGAESILTSLDSNDRDINTAIMQISKVYMQIGIDDKAKFSSDQMQDKVKEINTLLVLKPAWKTFKEMISYEDKVFLPYIVSILIKDLENSN